MKIFNLPKYHKTSDMYKDEDARLSVFSIVIITALSLILFIAESFYFGFNGSVFTILMVEALFVISSVVVVLYLMNSPEKKQYSAVVFFWLMVCVLGMITTDFYQQTNHLVSSSTHILVIISSYIIFHNQFRLQFLPAMILTVYSLVSTLFRVSDISSGVFIMVALTFLVTNVLGIAVTFALRKSREQHYNLQKQQQQMSRMLEKIAFVDDLTGVFNRRKIMELFENEFGRVKRYKGMLSVVMLDIDFFKHVNDKYGHDAGDCVLVEFARRLKKEVRETDFVSRFGGEEFLILMPETDIDGAVVVAERIKQMLDENPVSIGSTSIKVTASIGISQVRESDEVKEMPLKRADESLYMAKKAGRDTICSESEVLVEKDSTYYTP